MDNWEYIPPEVKLHVFGSIGVKIINALLAADERQMAVTDIVARVLPNAINRSNDVVAPFAATIAVFITKQLVTATWSSTTTLLHLNVEELKKAFRAN